MINKEEEFDKPLGVETSPGNPKIEEVVLGIIGEVVFTHSKKMPIDDAIKTFSDITNEIKENIPKTPLDKLQTDSAV